MGLCLVQQRLANHRPLTQVDTERCTLAPCWVMLHRCTLSRRVMPYYDPRLPLRPEQPELEFAVQQHEITSTEEWHQVCLAVLGLAYTQLPAITTCVVVSRSEQRCACPTSGGAPHAAAGHSSPDGACTQKHAVCGWHCPSVQVLADQPLTASRRRQLLLNFLQAKLEAEDEQLLLEGARVRTTLTQRHLAPI